MYIEPTTFSAEQYFTTQLPPPALYHDVKSQEEEGRAVVLVTCWVVTQPFPPSYVHNLVCDPHVPDVQFLQRYAVIFMHRQFNLQPFSRHYSCSTNPFLDLLDIDSSESQGATPRRSATPNKHEELLQVLIDYKEVHARGTLHNLTFVTVNDYL
ncbi:hypothetical protein CVT25_002565 [Psilocybe cyanescens]|uniref:Uncharacterized protein n=1 Tax=Psilocybe cyanescens TaxID=93625 RepID=A0A409WLD3_PSICY|nr:hypothetical protein CVT25_002565 [Psilocybe cyanescens]